MTCRRTRLFAAAMLVMVWRIATPAQTAVTLKGAGATFPAPLYIKWIANYARRDPSVAIAYDAVGSEAGMRRLIAGDVDFGASEDPGILRTIAPDRAGEFVWLPSVVGAVVPIVNIPGVTATVAFTPEALAGIYLGTITKWNDPRLQQNNRARLPNLDIVVVHRAEGSGTSYTWTTYLSNVNADWRTRVGAGLSPNWPIGEAATGNAGVAALVSRTAGAIGYVEFIYAVQAHVSYGQIRNRHGEFVTASVESIAAAAESSPPDAPGSSIVDAPGSGAYPVACLTWLAVPVRITNPAKHAALTGFLHWMLTSGQRQAAALGYVALPAPVVTHAEAAVSQIKSSEP